MGEEERLVDGEMLASVSSRSGITSIIISKGSLRNLIMGPLVVDLLAGLRETETPKPEKGSEILNQGTASQSQETEGHGRGIEDQDQNIESHAQGIGDQDRGTGGRGQETGSQGPRTEDQGPKTEDQGPKTENQDTGPGQGTSLGTGGTNLGPERRRKKRKGTDPALETDITRSTIKRGHETDGDRHQDPGPRKASRRAKMMTTVRN